MTGGELLERHTAWLPNSPAGPLEVLNAGINEIGNIEVRPGIFPTPTDPKAQAVHKALAILKNNR